jgi:transposase InsO family protein
MDLIHNPASISITTSTYWPYYLIVVCAYSRYGVLIPTWKSDTAAVIASIYDFVSFHKPYPDYSLDDISEIHADAGPCFRSQEFFDWGSDSQIKIVLAGSHHQEMNGLPERRWQAI